MEARLRDVFATIQSHQQRMDHILHINRSITSTRVKSMRWTEGSRMQSSGWGWGPYLPPSDEPSDVRERRHAGLGSLLAPKCTFFLLIRLFLCLPSRQSLPVIPCKSTPTPYQTSKMSPLARRGRLRRRKSLVPTREPGSRCQKSSFPRRLSKSLRAPLLPKRIVPTSWKGRLRCSLVGHVPLRSVLQRQTFPYRRQWIVGQMVLWQHLLIRHRRPFPRILWPPTYSGRSPGRRLKL